MNKKLLILIILSIFIVGMVIGVASASHTFYKGKYKLKVSDKTYNKIKKGKKSIDKKVGYKTVKKWKTKKMKTYESWFNSDGELVKSKSWSPYNKFKSKFKYVKTVTKYYSDGEITWDYFKVLCKVKKPVYFHVGGIYDFGKERFTGKLYVKVDTNRYYVL